MCLISTHLTSFPVIYINIQWTYLWKNFSMVCRSIFVLIYTPLFISFLDGVEMRVAIYDTFKSGDNKFTWFADTPIIWQGMKVLKFTVSNTDTSLPPSNSLPPPHSLGTWRQFWHKNMTQLYHKTSTFEGLGPCYPSNWFLLLFFDSLILLIFLINIK